MGSARNAVLGDAVSNVLAAAGWQVQREYYLNDAGTQMRTFAETLYRRYQQAFGVDAPLEQHHYQGEYMIELAQQVRAEHGDRFLHDGRRGSDRRVEPDRPGHRPGLDREIGRAARHPLRLLVLGEEPLRGWHLRPGAWPRCAAEGQTAVRDGAEWLLTSNFGADRDEVLVRSTGQPGYYASDVAYHYNKFVMRGFDRVIDVWAVDHQNQARRMPYLMKALGLDPARLDILLYDLVRLYRDGKEVKLSKRSGDIITIDEVIEEVGRDAVRFLLLTRANQSVIDFDLNLAVQQNDENPGVLRAVRARPDEQHPAHCGRAWFPGRKLGERRPATCSATPPS